MKSFIKTVSLTLVISVTALFFSSYKKVEAAGAGVVAGLDAALYIIAAVATGIASCLTVEVVKELNEFVESNYFADSFTKDEEGLFSYHPLSDNQQMDAVVEAAVAQYNNKVKNNEILSSDTSSSLSSEVYSDCVSNGVKDVLGSGVAAGITMGITTVNGKPQKVTTTYAESTVEVFDYLGLDYQMFNSLEDVFFDCSVTRTYEHYRPFIITADNKLYVFNDEIELSYYISSYSSAWIQFVSVTDKFSISTNGENDTYRAFRFYIKDGILGVAFYASNVDTYGRLNRGQFIVSNPSLSTYPVLFSDKLSYTTINSTNFKNYSANFNLYCVPDKTLIEANEIMSLDIACVGCFKGSSSQNTSPSSSTLQTASNMLAGTESIVQGGTNTTYSELSDIEKAIYALAKQQGITYEEMLEQSNLVVENGQIYLEGLDGVTHSIESLLSEFDKLLEQGDITNENIAASTEQLKAILEYLKGLNIEGLGSYIQQLETTLDGLKQGDEDREAILGDVLGQLQGLNNYLDSLGLNATAGDISQIKSDTKALADTFDQINNEIRKQNEKEKNAVILVSGLFNAGLSSYSLYDQCKYLIENIFNYDDVLDPPDFSFYWDSNGDGENELYNPFDLSFLETKLTGENMVDKSWFPVEIKVIDVIRYVIAIVIYGLFAMRLIKRLPTFYGYGPFTNRLL